MLNSLRPKLLVVLARYIDFAMHLDIIYMQMHSKNYAYRKAETTNNLGRREYILVTNYFLYYYKKTVVLYIVPIFSL